MSHQVASGILPSTSWPWRFLFPTKRQDAWLGLAERIRGVSWSKWVTFETWATKKKHLLPGNSASLWPFWDGEFRWPFQRMLNDLQIGNTKVTAWITWYFPLYWLFKRDPSNGCWNNSHINWVEKSPYIHIYIYIPTTTEFFFIAHMVLIAWKCRNGAHHVFCFFFRILERHV